MNRLLFTLLLCAVGFRAHDAALAQNTMHILARDTADAQTQNAMHSLAQGTVHALAPDTAHALMQNPMHPLAQGTIHALAPDTAHAQTQNTMHSQARDTAHTRMQDKSHAPAQNTIHASSQDTVRALLPCTTHALTAGRAAGGVDDPDSVYLSPTIPVPSSVPALQTPTPIPLIAPVIPLRNQNLSDSVLSGLDTPAWPARKILATGAVGGIFVGSLIGSYFDWWVDASQSFHFTDDGLFNNYSLGIDKVGHAYTSYFYFHTFRNVMRWGGYEERTAYWWAAGISAFFALSVEIGDGLSPFGFSAWDLSFNMLGLAYGMAQTSVPFLQNFKLKWSYVPPDGYRWPPRFTEHYDGHIYWVTCNVHNLLPESAQHWWPEFLQLAVGYGVDDLQTRREMMVGLDLNLCVFRTQQPELRLLEQTVDLFHIPMPSVKFTEGKTPRYYIIGWN